MKIKIAVCDSDKQVLDYLRDMIIRQQPAAEVTTFSSAEGLLQSGTDFSIYILDVKGVDGMEIASILRSREQVTRSIIIFVTGYREYMPAAFDVQAFHYLLKPIDKEKFAQVLENACLEAAHIQKQKEEYILLKVNDGQNSSWERRKVWLMDILFIESNNKTQVLHAVDGTYEVQGKMDEFEQALGDGFYRCHRCYLVNFAKIVAYSQNEIQVTGGEKIMLAHKKYPAFVKAYMRYAKGGGMVNV